MRICSDREALDRRLLELAGFLTQRGYRQKKIENAFERSKLRTRAETLLEVQKEPSTRITLTVTYNPQVADLPGVIFKHWKAMTRDKRMERIFKEPPMVSFRQPPNLKKLLCKAKLPGGSTRPTRQATVGLQKCGKKVCSCCSYLNTMKPTICSNTGSQFNVGANVTCETQGVVYCLTCKHCKSQYIGQASKRLKDSVQEHIG